MIIHIQKREETLCPTKEKGNMNMSTDMDGF